MKFRRILSALLTASLLLGLLGVPVYADSEEVEYQTGSGDWTKSSLADAVTAIGSGTGTIKVLQDITLTEPVSVKGNLTLIPEEGKEVTIARGFASGASPAYSSPGDAMFHLAAKKTLTLGDSGTGTLILDGQKESYPDCAGPILYVNSNVNNKATLQLESNVELRNNHNAKEGGALDLEGYTTASIQGATFSGNESGKNGGALYIYNSNAYNASNQIRVVVEDAVFQNNYAKESGGAIYARPTGTQVVLTGTTFESNSAQQGSAVTFDTAAHISERTGSSALAEAVVLDGCTFTGNTYNEEPPTMTSMAAFTYDVSNTVYFGNKPSKIEDRTLVWKGETTFRNETASDIALYCYEYGAAGKNPAPVLYLDDTFSAAGSGPIRVMTGAYAVNGDKNADIFKCSSAARAAELAARLTQADDPWGACNKGEYVQFVSNPDSEGGLMLQEAKYKVTVQQADNGRIDADAGQDPLTSVPAGATVTVTVVPDDGFQLQADSLQVDADSGVEVELEPVWGREDAFTFQMPGSDVTVTASFEKSGHTITTEGDIEHGDVELTPQGGLEPEGPVPAGTQVDVTVTPEEGYSIQSVEVKTAGGDPVDLEPVPEPGSENYTGSFEMPDDEVTVTVTLVPIQYEIEIIQPSDGGSLAADAETAIKGQ